MAMEVSAPKQLQKHALPVVIVVMALTFLPLATIMSQSSLNGHSLLGSLTRNFISVRPTADGRGVVTINKGSPVPPAAGSYLSGGLTQTGGDASLWMNIPR